METLPQKQMQDSLQTTTNSSGTSREMMISNDPELRKIARIIAVKINSLYAYPLSKSQVEDWTEIIHELLPDLTAEKLDKIANEMILGVHDWDYHKGIQNLVLAVKGPYNPMIERMKEAIRESNRKQMPKIVV